MSGIDEREPTAGAGDPLPRRLGLASATALVVGEVIGVGIFLTPAGMARSLGSPAWLLAAWLAMGGSAAAGALCFGALAARYPEAGGGYVYLKAIYGRRIAFLSGWLSLLVTDPGITAALAVGLSTYAGPLLGLSRSGRTLAAIGAILAMASANIAGLRIGAGMLRALTILKVGALVALAAWGFGGGLGSWSNFRPFLARSPSSGPISGALVGAAIAAFFSFGGWWDASKVAGEVRDPARNLPRALTLGVGIVTASYVLVSAVFLYLVPLSSVSTDRGFAEQAGSALFGRAGGLTFSIIVIVSVLGSLAGILMAAPRVYYAMARDGLFPGALAAIHPRTGTPIASTLVLAVIASGLAASGTFDQILAYFIAPTIAFLILIVGGVYLAGPPPVGNPSARVPGYPITPLIFIIPAATIMALLGLGDPSRTALGAGVVALGALVYQLAFRREPSPSIEVPSDPSATP